MASKRIPVPFVALREMAHLSGLPVHYIKARADDGTIPSIKIGQRLMFSPRQVLQLLESEQNHTVVKIMRTMREPDESQLSAAF